jgi:hypothetical protein
MRRCTFTVAAGLASILAGARPSRAQAPVTLPVVELPAATAVSTERFGTILGVRELPDGSVLVDDAARKQVKMLGPGLALAKVVFDTVRGQPNFYGPRIMPLIPYPGDSTLFPTLNSRSLAMLDPRGENARALTTPVVNDVFFLRRGGTDGRGRLFFAGEPKILSQEVGKPPIVSDSTPIVRIDFAARTNDTVAYIARPLWYADAISAANLATVQRYFNPDPLRTLDEWAVLADGTLAVVRGHDYRVDFIRPDGSTFSSPKLPFDWRPLSDADKEKMIDSALALRKLAARTNTLVNGIEKLVVWQGTGRGQEAGPGTERYPRIDTVNALVSKNNGGGDMIVLNQPRRKIEEVFDYYPPVRDRAAMADMDDHLWILPTTSKQSKAGELVYDNVNAKGELFQRVRVPLGRYVVGFGRNGTVYLAWGSIASGFVLERTRLPGAR